VPPSGSVAQIINGATYLAFGGANYRPFYSGSSVIYQVVARPTRRQRADQGTRLELLLGRMK
jgi:hypothetical protein